MYPGERLNSSTHLIGTLLAVAGLVVLVVMASLQADPWKIVSFSLYGATLVLLYGVSTLYHSVRGRAKAWLQKCDHSAIYLLIAGSYTPFSLVTLRGPWGWSLFGVSWGLALFGIVQELTLGRRTRVLSMLLYVAMGWLVLVAAQPLVAALPLGGLIWLGLGGVCYSVGIYWFIHDEKIRHGHGIWHLFVLAGSVCQFISVAAYVA
ncbi:MAG: hemolysin III family protein [Curvibacter lanceolatus]|jgi:hemolysin III|uniref:PAQR family membrane homeostasis protein TrhA n=1 Tax=Curvibacter lanceolatus TaxID=86182 RepID=UPI00037816A3|nr:hemolysin III family protein [Curvibacter lanceolatus]MBV5292571.1 hemolysin III family protein [Curvibacter lanceolatus]